MHVKIATILITFLSLIAMSAVPASAAHPVGGPYEPNAEKGRGYMDGWVNWNASCGADSGLRCHTYMKLTDSSGHVVAGKWIGGNGWHGLKGYKSKSHPWWGAPCDWFYTWVQHYTEKWVDGRVKTVKQTWMSGGRWICRWHM